MVDQAALKCGQPPCLLLAFFIRFLIIRHIFIFIIPRLLVLSMVINGDHGGRELNRLVTSSCLRSEQSSRGSNQCTSPWLPPSPEVLRNSGKEGVEPNLITGPSVQAGGSAREKCDRGGKGLPGRQRRGREPRSLVAAEAGHRVGFSPGASRRNTALLIH